VNETYFALVISSFGQIFVGETYSNEFEAWQNKGMCFTLHKPRRLAIAQAATQPGASNTNCSVINIGPSYFGDTPQQILYLQSVAVEIIGKIENGACSENKQLYSQYINAYQEWMASRSGLYAPSVQDIANLTNVTKFPKRN
jgi:hypothetical protein